MVSLAVSRGTGGWPTGCPTNAAAARQTAACGWMCDDGWGWSISCGQWRVCFEFAGAGHFAGLPWPPRVAMGLEFAAGPRRKPTGSFMTALCGGEGGDACDSRLFSTLLAQQRNVPWVAEGALLRSGGSRASGASAKKRPRPQTLSRPHCSEKAPFQQPMENYYFHSLHASIPKLQTGFLVLPGPQLSSASKQESQNSS